MKEIQEMAVNGKPAIEAMGTIMKIPSWDDILILGAQLNPMPLEEHAEVSLKTIIGKSAKKPMELVMPVYISHMSFGALSKETKLIFPKEAQQLAQQCAAEKVVSCLRKKTQPVNIFLNMCQIYTALLMKT